MFMRFRGGGVGHLGTRYLTSRLKEDDHDPGNEQQDEATIPGLYKVINSFSNEEDIEKNPGMHKARSDEDVEEFEDEDGEEESESDEEEMPRDMSDEQDTDNAS